MPSDTTDLDGDADTTELTPLDLDGNPRFADDPATIDTGSGIPAVVANQLPVPDATVATFVGALYEELLRSGDIDLAVTEGRIRLAVDLGSSPKAVLEWGIPTLYRHINGAQVLES